MLPSPKYLGTPSSNREGTRKTQTSDRVKNKASDKFTRMVYESRRQAAGCPKEQRVILVAVSRSKETKAIDAGTRPSHRTHLLLCYNSSSIKYEAVNQAIAVL